MYIADRMGMRLYRYNESSLPGAANRLLDIQMTSESRIPYISRNDELYLGYFIIMTLITMFYKIRVIRR